MRRAFWDSISGPIQEETRHDLSADVPLVRDAYLLLGEAGEGDGSAMLLPQRAVLTERKSELEAAEYARSCTLHRAPRDDVQYDR